MGGANPALARPLMSAGDGAGFMSWPPGGGDCVGAVWR